MKNRMMMFKIAAFIIMFSFAWFHSAVAMAEGKADEPETIAAPEPVSTGEELMEWMEAHKNVGGTVKLEGSVVLDGYCCFCPNGVDMPSVFVDTGGYTITVTGETELWSDGHLIIRGQSGEQGLFHVAAGGQLSLNGVIVEGGQCALWQEEGAGLIVDQCQVSGAIHYADTPFVFGHRPAYVIVEPGQTADNAFPAEITGSVNRQGQVTHNEKIPVTWNLEGTGTQQEERKRFSVQGSFSSAASRDPAVCTVIYNDYPLTFLEVRAVASPSLYQFQGWYAIPEEKLPITVSSEYSFDGSNWIESEKMTVSSISDGFFIGISSEQWDTERNPYIYIRLRWDDGGICHFSNVLRYEAGDLGYAEDQGGSRGGGTSIVNPPEEPRQELPDKSGEEPSDEPIGNTPKEPGQDPSDEPRGNTPKEPGQDQTDKPGKDPSDEPIGNTPKEPGQDQTDKPRKDPSGELQGNPPSEPREDPSGAHRGNPSNEPQQNPPGSPKEHGDAQPGYAKPSANPDDIAGVQSGASVPGDVEAAESAGSGQGQVRPRHFAAEKSEAAVPKIYNGKLPGNIKGTGFMTLFIFGVAAGFFLYVGRLRRHFHAHKKSWFK